MNQPSAGQQWDPEDPPSDINGDPPPDGVSIALAWFPSTEWESAKARWPEVTERFGDVDSATYNRAIQQHLLDLPLGGATADVSVAPIYVTEFTQWCSEVHTDAGSAQARSACAADLSSHGDTIPWPPARNEPCWCGSQRKYKKCCGTVVPSE